jgi:hypothetical protein
MLQHSVKDFQRFAKATGISAQHARDTDSLQKGNRFPAGSRDWIADS